MFEVFVKQAVNHCRALTASDQIVIEGTAIEKLAVSLPDDNVVGARVQPLAHPSEDGSRRTKIVVQKLGIPFACRLEANACRLEYPDQVVDGGRRLLWEAGRRG
jgi:hypothetical protein